MSLPRSQTLGPKTRDPSKIFNVNISKRSRPSLPGCVVRSMKEKKKETRGSLVEIPAPVPRQHSRIKSKSNNRSALIGQLFWRFITFLRTVPFFDGSTFVLLFFYRDKSVPVTLSTDVALEER